jgi:hypothetical protein
MSSAGSGDVQTASAAKPNNAIIFLGMAKTPSTKQLNRETAGGERATLIPHTHAGPPP